MINEASAAGVATACTRAASKVPPDDFLDATVMTPQCTLRLHALPYVTTTYGLATFS